MAAPSGSPHGIPTAPPDSIASPHLIDFAGGAEQWWRPGWKDVARHLGWRWLLVLPAMLVPVLVVVFFFEPQLFRMFWAIGLKAFVTTLTLPFVVAGYAVSSAVRTRTEPFCIHCGYDLLGLPDQHRCPECGRPYTFALIEEYRRDRNWFIQR